MRKEENTGLDMAGLESRRENRRGEKRWRATDRKKRRQGEREEDKSRGQEMAVGNRGQRIGSIKKDRGGEKMK